MTEEKKNRRLEREGYSKIKHMNENRLSYTDKTFDERVDIAVKMLSEGKEVTHLFTVAELLRVMTRMHEIKMGWKASPEVKETENITAFKKLLTDGVPKDNPVEEANKIDVDSTQYKHASDYAMKIVDEAREAVKEAKPEKMMRVHSNEMGLKEVPMRFFNEDWAQKIHDQSLTTLDSRGGLSLIEMVCNIRRYEWEKAKTITPDGAFRYIKSLLEPVEEKPKEEKFGKLALICKNCGKSYGSHSTDNPEYCPGEINWRKSTFEPVIEEVSKEPDRDIKEWEFHFGVGEYREEAYFTNTKLDIMLSGAVFKEEALRILEKLNK